MLNSKSLNQKIDDVVDYLGMARQIYIAISPGA